MEIVAYTLPGCVSCKRLKELFRRAEVTYSEIMLSRDIESDIFLKKYPDIHRFPFVVIDNAPVGGLVETVKMFVQQGLVSSSKKE